MNTHDLPPTHPYQRPRHAGKWLLGAMALTGLLFAGMTFHELAQRRELRRRDAMHLTGGDPDRAPELMRAYGCARCHTIPGVPGADGLIGPPLTGIAQRMFVGGVVTNTPENLVRWIMNPQAIDSRTAMPAMGVSEEQARDIAAYLYAMP